MWAGLLVAAGLRELAALFLLPSLTTTSYAYPTMSALTDPLLARHLGRSVALATWVAMAGIGAQMNSHNLTVLGCLILLATGVLLEVLATRTRARIRRWSTCSPASCGPGPGESASLPRRRGVGLHFFARR